MNPALHKNLLSETEKLKRVTSELSLESMVNLAVSQQQMFNRGFKSQKEALSSPLRQGMFLLGVACSQQEPTEPKPLDDGKYDQLIKLLNSIFNSYAFAYFPTKSETVKGLDAKWHRSREIAMPAFLNYYLSGFKVSTDQIKSWIDIYFDGYEDRIREKFKIDHHSLLKAGKLFESKIAENHHNLKDVMEKADAFRLKFIKDVEDGKDFHEATSEVRDNEELSELLSAFFNGSNEVYSITRDEINRELGTGVATSLIENFSTTRGGAEEITYITEDNPIVKRPILTADSNRFYFLINNSFYQGIIDSIEDHLSSGKSGHKYLRNRDKRLENQAADQFKKVFDGNAAFYVSSYEINTRHNEHDLIIRHQRNLYIVEAKASPPRVPLRDPNKAFQKISDHFRSKAGIQKAFNQANSLRNKILENGEQKLYSHEYEEIASLNKNDFDNIYTICVTRDDFGALATNLSLLLEKDETSPYPWVISITDLEFLIDGFKHVDFGIEEINKYIDQRIQLHGKVLGTDELEYAGAFLKYGGLEHFITSDADLIPLDMSESDIFDEIYFAEISGEKYNLEPVDPVSMKLDRNKIFGDNSKKKNANEAKRKKKRARKQSAKSRKRNKRSK